LQGRSCIQLELDIEKNDIQLFSLHPEGVRIDVTLAALDPTLDELLPGVSLLRRRVKPLSRLLTLSRVQTNGEGGQVLHAEMNIELCAAPCVYLATGKAKAALRGSYFDVSHVSASSLVLGCPLPLFPSTAFCIHRTFRLVVTKEGSMHGLKVDFLGGLPDDGGHTRGASDAAKKA
jgi:hypothetical protein